MMFYSISGAQRDAAFTDHAHALSNRSHIPIIRRFAFSVGYALALCIQTCSPDQNRARMSQKNISFKCAEIRMCMRDRACE